MESQSAYEEVGGVELIRAKEVHLSEEGKGSSGRAHVGHPSLGQETELVKHSEDLGGGLVNGAEDCFPLRRHLPHHTHQLLRRKTVEATGGLVAEEKGPVAGRKQLKNVYCVKRSFRIRELINQITSLIRMPNAQSKSKLEKATKSY